MDVAGETARKEGERVAVGEDHDQIMDVVERGMGADLADQTAAGLLVRRDRGEPRADALKQALLEAISEMVAGGMVAGSKRAADLVMEACGILRHQVPADPAPERLEASTRQTAGKLAMGLAVDQKWIERPEHQPRSALEARSGAAGVAHDCADLIEQEVTAGDIVTTQRGAFELCDQQRPRPCREFPQVFPQPLDGQAFCRHSGPTYSNTAMALDNRGSLRSR